ncbi:hypothetical protein ILUMI_03849 [Ignelater luminosus]|uniref:Uncharacterized protein n=1 Tax=Ignelater luminosus TaxID=2038154 RepID=A0A8K0GJJ5_IGNLU|nr:hypothetical protein ILUMI_03849 [Ignelater luminosus]
MIEYATVAPLVCLEIYAATESSVVQTTIRHCTIFVVLTAQLAFYCIPANYLTNEAVAISDAIYSSNWYSHYLPSLTKPILFMIQNSQREIIITAGGILIINARTVLNVLKVAWSTCTVIKGIK